MSVSRRSRLRKLLKAEAQPAYIEWGIATTRTDDSKSASGYTKYFLTMPYHVKQDISMTVASNDEVLQNLETFEASLKNAISAKVTNSQAIIVQKIKYTNEQ